MLNKKYFDKKFIYYDNNTKKKSFLILCIFSKIYQSQNLTLVS